MSPNESSARVILTTTPSPEEASGLARALVDERLAACATIIPGVRSIYRWEGKVEDSRETLLLIKTAADQIASLQTRLHALHPYQTPEFLVLPVESGSVAYLEWLLDSIEKPQ